MGVAIIKTQPLVELGPISVEEKISLHLGSKGRESQYQIDYGVGSLAVPQLSSQLWKAPEPALNLAVDAALLIGLIVAIGAGAASMANMKSESKR